MFTKDVKQQCNNNKKRYHYFNDQAYNRNACNLCKTVTLNFAVLGWHSVEGLEANFHSMSADSSAE